MVLGLVDTIDTVMGHISSNLRPRETHVTLTGSSSTAGSRYQIGRQWGLWGKKCWMYRPLAFTLPVAHATAEINHHFLSSVPYAKSHF